MPLPGRRCCFEAPPADTAARGLAASRAARARCELVLAGGSMPTTSRRDCARSRRSASTCRAASRSPPGIKEPDADPRASSGGATREPGSIAHERRVAGDDTRASCSTTTLAGRYPDGRGRFGPFGGRYVPETLVPALDRLEAGVAAAPADAAISSASSQRELRDWAGRPTALTHAARELSRAGARRSGSSARTSRTPARTRSTTRSARRCSPSASARGASSRRQARASTASRPPRPARGSACLASSTWARSTCERQAPNVGRMKLLGARSCRSTSGDQTLRAAIDEALRDWVSDPDGTYYLLGSAVGPHPYPYLVRELQSRHRSRGARADARPQPVRCRTSRSPASAAARMRSACSTRSCATPACDCSASRRAAAAAGSATMRRRSPSAARACCTAATRMLLQDAHGQVQETHSVSAGLDYSAVRARARAARS